MTALPIASPDEDPLDPERILRELPERERADFLRAYRDAVAGAQDPAGWKNLQRTLRIWRGLVIAANRPGFYEAQDLAVAGTGAGLPLPLPAATPEWLARAGDSQPDGFS